MEKILIVVDMQNDFITGSLGTNEAKSILENVKAKIRHYDRKNIYATRDTHDENYLHTQEGQNLPIKHCIRGTDGWQIESEIAKMIDTENIVDKLTFGSKDLVKILLDRYAGKDIEIEIVGLCTDICVVSNALILKAFMPEVSISVDKSCCAGVTPKAHENAIATMKSCQIRII